MRVQTFSSSGMNHEFDSFSWEIAFHGQNIDERSQTAIGFVQHSSSKMLLAEYDNSQPGCLSLAGSKARSNELIEQMNGKQRVLLEATSLGLVEILLLLRAAKDASLTSIDCLYVEPLDYKRDVFIESPWQREFSLSESRRFEGVRGFTTNFSETLPESETRFVAFLGYEAARLAQACEQVHAIVGWNKYAVFGVPGYSPGWEMNAMANNVGVLDRHQFESVRYCPASGISGALKLLDEIHAEGRSGNVHTVIAPLGTKPHGIAAALFLIKNANYQTSSLMYDHPTRSAGRSSRVRRWHMYRIKLNGDI